MEEESGADEEHTYREYTPVSQTSEVGDAVLTDTEQPTPKPKPKRKRRVPIQPSSPSSDEESADKFSWNETKSEKSGDEVSPTNDTPGNDRSPNSPSNERYQERYERRSNTRHSQYYGDGRDEEDSYSNARDTRPTQNKTSSSPHGRDGRVQSKDSRNSRRRDVRETSHERSSYTRRDGQWEQPRDQRRDERRNGRTKIERRDDARDESRDSERREEGREARREKVRETREKNRRERDEYRRQKTSHHMNKTRHRSQPTEPDVESDESYTDVWGARRNHDSDGREDVRDSFPSFAGHDRPDLTTAREAVPVTPTDGGSSPGSDREQAPICEDVRRYQKMGSQQDVRNVSSGARATVPRGYARKGGWQHRSGDRGQNSRYDEQRRPRDSRERYTRGDRDRDRNEARHNRRHPNKYIHQFHENSNRTYEERRNRYSQRAPPNTRHKPKHYDSQFRNHRDERERKGRGFDARYRKERLKIPPRMRRSHPREDEQKVQEPSRALSHDSDRHSHTSEPKPIETLPAPCPPPGLHGTHLNASIPVHSSLNSPAFSSHRGTPEAQPLLKIKDAAIQQIGPMQARIPGLWQGPPLPSNRVHAFSYVPYHYPQHYAPNSEQQQIEKRRDLCQILSRQHPTEELINQAMSPYAKTKKISSSESNAHKFLQRKAKRGAQQTSLTFDPKDPQLQDQINAPAKLGINKIQEYGDELILEPRKKFGTLLDDIEKEVKRNNVRAMIALNEHEKIFKEHFQRMRQELKEALDNKCERIRQQKMENVRFMKKIERHLVEAHNEYWKASKNEEKARAVKEDSRKFLTMQLEENPTPVPCVTDTKLEYKVYFSGHKTKKKKKKSHESSAAAALEEKSEMNLASVAMSADGSHDSADEREEKNVSGTQVSQEAACSSSSPQVSGVSGAADDRAVEPSSSHGSNASASDSSLHNSSTPYAYHKDRPISVIKGKSPMPVSLLKVYSKYLPDAQQRALEITFPEPSEDDSITHYRLTIAPTARRKVLVELKRGEHSYTYGLDESVTEWDGIIRVESVNKYGTSKACQVKV